MIQYRNITCIPSFHTRLQFALEVRKVFEAVRPDIIAVELPDIYFSDVLQAIRRLPRLTLLCLEQSETRFSYIPIFPSDSMIEAIRLGHENSLPVAFIDLAVKDYAIVGEPFAVPDEYAIHTTGLPDFYAAVAPHLPVSEPGSPDRRREEHMAAHLKRLSKDYERILVITGLNHWQTIVSLIEDTRPQYQAHELESISAPFLAKPGKKALHSLLGEMPYLVLHFELSRHFGLHFDKLRSLKRLILEARNAPAVAAEEYSVRELQNVLQYANKLALIDRRLAPDLFNLILAAKQTLGDDYAIEVLERALHYPYQDQDDIPEIEFDPAQAAFLLGGRKIELRRRLPQQSLDTGPERDWIQLEIQRKKKEEISAFYFSDWIFFGFFSHIPEDLVLEGFIDRLGDKLASELQHGETRTHEFQGSLMDGLDMRETIRHHHLGKIFVKEHRPLQLSLGAWILIFDEDLSEWKYPWVLALSAEHHNESDIAFYAANPALHPVTRDIVRSHYGAMLAFKPALPAGEKIDWTELDVDEGYRKEQLLQTAIRVSPRPGILYLASQPPEPYYFQLAASKGKQLLFLPISRLSQRHLKRIQRFHLLKSRSTRRSADDYI